MKLSIDSDTDTIRAKNFSLIFPLDQAIEPLFRGFHRHRLSSSNSYYYYIDIYYWALYSASSQQIDAPSPDDILVLPLGRQRRITLKKYLSVKMHWQMPRMRTLGDVSLLAHYRDDAQ